jgi:hypothetical protein
MKSGVYSIKTVLVSEDQNVLMNNSIFINKYSRFKELVIQYEPTLYKRHCLKSILNFNDLSVRRIVNWPMLILELFEENRIDDEIFKQ